MIAILEGILKQIEAIHMRCDRLENVLLELIEQANRDGRFDDAAKMIELMRPKR